jgi:hypothetical protein
VQALIANDPSNLPVCPWFGKQCDYSKVCDCATTAISASREIADLAGEIYVDDTTCEQLLSKMAGSQPSQSFGINDIVFPRKAYFERLKESEEVREEKEEYLRSMDELGFLDALRDSLRFGSPGEAQRIPVKHSPLADLVQTWRNSPTILRNPKLSSLVERERLPQMFPHYFLRLGFDCAFTENTKGRLLLYYVKVLKEDAKLMVYDVTFKNLNAVKAEALHRLELLEKATSPLQLPKCPSWMCTYCDYRLECGEA